MKRAMLKSPGAVEYLTVQGGWPNLATALDRPAVPERGVDGATTAGYFIWSHEHRAWWRPNRQGYTTDLLQAGVYNRTDSIDICNTRGVPCSEEAVPVIDRAYELREIVRRIHEILNGAVS